MTIYPLLLKPLLTDVAESGLFVNMAEENRKGPAESPALSCRREDPSRIQNGEMAGKALPEAIEIWGRAALGEKAAKFPFFPILVKFADVREKQPVAVHPDKTELWYIVDCEPGARLVYGLNGGLTKEEFRRRVQNDTLSEICNFMPVKKGDAFLIEAGTLHAAGEGMLVAKIEQALSDCGAGIGLDTEKAVRTTLLRPSCTPCGAIGEIADVPGGTCRRLASCECFTAQLLEITESMLIGCMESFLSLLCVEGSGTLEWDGGKPLAFKKGTSVFLPAGITAHIKTPAEAKAQILCSRI